MKTFVVTISLKATPGAQVVNSDRAVLKTALRCPSLYAVFSDVSFSPSISRLIYIGEASDGTARNLRGLMISLKQSGAYHWRSKYPGEKLTFMHFYDFPIPSLDKPEVRKAIEGALIRRMWSFDWPIENFKTQDRFVEDVPLEVWISGVRMTASNVHSEYIL